MPSRSRGARPLTTKEKGLGHDHRGNREGLLARHPDGRLCWWCGKPMYKDRRRNHDYNPNATRKDGKPDTTSGELQADHTKTRSTHGRNKTRADRLLHGLCNKQRGDGTRDHQRPALTAIHNTLQTVGDGLGALTMGWPDTWQ